MYRIIANLKQKATFESIVLGTNNSILRHNVSYLIFMIAFLIASDNNMIKKRGNL